MQDFISYTISGIMSLFAALIGVAYPLILQAAQRIDDKYHSAILTQYVINKPSLVIFRVLMGIAIPVAILSPFLIYLCQDDECCCLSILCVQSLLTLAQLVNLYYIHYVIQKAIIPPAFLEMLVSENARNKRISEIFAFSRLYVIETEPDLIRQATRIVFKYIREESDSDTKNRILHSIVKLLEESDPKRQTIYCKSPDLWDTILSSESKFDKEMRELWTWRFIQSSLYANNTEQIIRYWSWADQFAGASQAKYESGKTNEEEIKGSRHFNTMVCAALVYGNQWETLREVLYYSHMYPPKYDLLLNTFPKLIEELRFISSQDFNWLTKFTMRGMRGGVLIDENIKSLAVRYIALSYLRLQSVNDYNITYSEPMTLPELGTNISICKQDLGNAQWLLSQVREWQRQLDIVNRCLSPYYDYTEKANTLLEQYIEELNEHIEELKKHPKVSQDKKERFLNELKEAILEDKLGLPATDVQPTDFELMYDKSRYEYRFPVPKTYLSEGVEWGYDLPETLVKKINADVRWTYYSQCFLIVPPQKSYKIGYNQIVDAIERLQLDSRFEVWVSGNFIANYLNVNADGARKLQLVGDNTWLINGCEIHQFKCRMDVAIVVEKGQVPVVYSRKFKLLEERDLKEIEPVSHFYSNIENEEYENFNERYFEINLGRIVEFYAPKGRQYVRLDLTYPESYPSVLEEIESIEKLCEKTKGKNK